MFDSSPLNHANINFQDAVVIGNFLDSFDQWRLYYGESNNGFGIKINLHLAPGGIDVIGQQLGKFKHDARKIIMVGNPDRHRRLGGQSRNASRQQNRCRQKRRQPKTHTAFCHQRHLDKIPQRPEYIKNCYISVMNEGFCSFHNSLWLDFSKFFLCGDMPLLKISSKALEQCRLWTYDFDPKDTACLQFSSYASCSLRFSAVWRQKPAPRRIYESGFPSFPPPCIRFLTT